MIHPTAVIETGAELGDDVHVGAHAYIAATVRVGNGCRIGPQATLLSHTTLGAECRVHAHAVLGDEPQDAGFKGEESYLAVGAGCVIREGATLHRGSDGGSSTVIGDNCFIMANAHCAHNTRLGAGVIMANGVLLGGHVEIGDQAFLSGNVLVHQFVRIGRLCMLSGMTLASKDVPPFCMTGPGQLNVVDGINTVGLRRAGISPEGRRDIKTAFKLLYRNGLNATQACEQMLTTTQAPEAHEMAAFVSASERGICGPADERPID